MLEYEKRMKNLLEYEKRMESHARTGETNTRPCYNSRKKCKTILEYEKRM
jgi:hypothetical protein